MKNKALISLSFIILFGLSACSTSSQKPQNIAQKKPKAIKNTPSARPKNYARLNQQKQSVAQKNEQKRLAYNHAWQKKQKLNRNKRAVTQIDFQARNQWKQQQARNQLQAQEQQRLVHQYTQQQNQRAQQLAVARKQNQQTQTSRFRRFLKRLVNGWF